MTRIYIDENISPHIASALDILEKPLGSDFEVVSIISVFGKGALDEDWLPKIGAEGAVVITQDLNIYRTKSQRKLFEEHQVGVFFLSPPSKHGYHYWEMVEQIIKRWQEIRKSFAGSDGRLPFAALPEAATSSSCNRCTFLDKLRCGLAAFCLTLPHGIEK